MREIFPSFHHSIIPSFRLLSEANLRSFGFSDRIIRKYGYIRQQRQRFPTLIYLLTRHGGMVHRLLKRTITVLPQLRYDAYYLIQHFFFRFNLDKNKIRLLRIDPRHRGVPVSPQGRPLQAVIEYLTAHIHPQKDPLPCVFPGLLNSERLVFPERFLTYREPLGHQHHGTGSPRLGISVAREIFLERNPPAERFPTHWVFLRRLSLAAVEKSNTPITQRSWLPQPIGRSKRVFLTLETKQFAFLHFPAVTAGRVRHPVEKGSFEHISETIKDLAKYYPVFRKMNVLTPRKSEGGQGEPSTPALTPKGRGKQGIARISTNSTAMTNMFYMMLRTRQVAASRPAHPQSVGFFDPLILVLKKHLLKEQSFSSYLRVVQLQGLLMTGIADPLLSVPGKPLLKEENLFPHPSILEFQAPLMPGVAAPLQEVFKSPGVRKTKTGPDPQQPVVETAITSRQQGRGMSRIGTHSAGVTNIFHTISGPPLGGENGYRLIPYPVVYPKVGDRAMVIPFREPVARPKHFTTTVGFLESSFSTGLPTKQITPFLLVPYRSILKKQAFSSYLPVLKLPDTLTGRVADPLLLIPGNRLLKKQVFLSCLSILPFPGPLSAGVADPLQEINKSRGTPGYIVPEKMLGLDLEKSGLGKVEPPGVVFHLASPETTARMKRERTGRGQWQTPALDYIHPVKASPQGQGRPLQEIGTGSVPGESPIPGAAVPHAPVEHTRPETAREMNINMHYLTDRVYQMLESRIRSEREMRGW